MKLLADKLICPPEQIGPSLFAVTVGCGLIVMAKVTGDPTHVPMEGVTVIIPIKGVVPLFVPVNAGVFPVPVEASPIALLEFVQFNVAPEGVVEKLLAAT